MSAKQTITELENLEKTAKKYLEDNLELLIEENVISEIKSVAKAMNLPDKFIDGITFKKVGPLHIKIINTWGTQDKPLARWFNYGTPQHWIEPINAKVLAWGGKSGKNASAIFFQGNNPEGMKFSKGHYVSGVPKTEAMENGIKLGMEKLKAIILKSGREKISKELETIE